jgi:flagellar export protein FliJ
VSQYDQLVRLRDWELDEKRWELVEVQAAVDALIHKREALEEEVQREKDIASTSYEASVSYNAFANSVILRREQINAEIEERMEAVEAANEEMLVAFQELSKAEIVRDDFDAQERLKEARREQMELDEIAQTLHRRKRGR